MTTPSSIPAVIDALVATFAAVLDASIVNDGPGATVPDGPLMVYVGVDNPDDEGPIVAAESDQEWAALGHAQRDETITVHNVIRAWNGDADQKVARDLVFATMATVAASIQSDPTLGGIALYALGISSSTLRQWQDGQGAGASLDFTVTVRARIS